MLGLVSISFRKNAPFEIIDAARASGLEAIEWGSDVHAPASDIKRIQEIKSECESNGIACSSYGTYFRIGVHSSEELHDYIAAAKVLGTDLIRVWCGNKNAQDYSSEERNALFKECEKLAKIAEQENVKLCMECHSNTFVNEKESALMLMGTVASPNFRMYWQPNQYKSEAENIEYAQMLSAYTEAIHVFHWQKDIKLPLLDAVETWRRYVECFRKDILLLLEFMPDDRLESLKAESAALRRIVF